MRLESISIVLVGIIGFDSVGFVLANDVWGVLGRQTFQFFPCRVRIRVEDAYYVGDVFV